MTISIPPASLQGLRRSLLHRVERVGAPIRRRREARERRSSMRDIATAAAALYPDGERQERVLNFVPFLARYGTAADRSDGEAERTRDVGTRDCDDFDSERARRGARVTTATVSTPEPAPPSTTARNGRRRGARRSGDSCVATSRSRATVADGALSRCDHRNRRRRIHGGVQDSESAAELVWRGRTLGVVHSGLLEPARARRARRSAGASPARWRRFSRSSPLGSCSSAYSLAPYLIPVIAPGFTGDKRELTITLTRILFPGAGVFVLVRVVSRRTQ